MIEFYIYICIHTCYHTFKCSFFGGIPLSTTRTRPQHDLQEEVHSLAEAQRRPDGSSSEEELVMVGSGWSIWFCDVNDIYYINMYYIYYM